MTLGMGEDFACAGEKAWGQRCWKKLLGLLSVWGLNQDAFDATGINEVHLQGLPAGGVQAFGRVTLAQPQKLVALPDSGPGQVTVKEAFGELGHRWAQLGGATPDAVGRPEAVGTQLGGVVGGVGGAAAFGLAVVDLDQLALVEDAHQLQAQAYLHLLLRRAKGGGN